MSILDSDFDYDLPFEEPSDAPPGVLLSDVEPESVAWLWYGRIPLGKITVLDGDPGLGKSTATLDLAARVTRGLPFPDDRRRIDPAGVVLLSAEDDLGDTIRPRLDAAGADVSRVVALQEVIDDGGRRPPVLPDDLPWVRAAIERVGAKLVVIDPLMAFLSGGLDAHKDQQVRRGLHQLALLASSTGAAILLVRHLNKAPGGNPMYRGGGSIGIVGAARSGLLVGRDPGDINGRVLASTKCNLAPEPRSIAFHLVAAPEQASHIVWDGECDFDAQAILADPPGEDERTARKEAEAFIKTTLAEGPVAAKDIERMAEESAISLRTLKRAKKGLGVVSAMQGYQGAWEWSLPERSPR